MGNEVCVVTGGARGIGLAMVKALLARGARVTAVDLDTGSMADLGSSLLTVNADVTKPDDMERVVAETERCFGKVSVWVNNAGVARHRWITDYTEADIDLMLGVNLKGTILGSQAALRCMKSERRGHIINVISTASLRGIPSESVYCAAKWGVRGFTQGLQEEAAAFRVRVTAVLPGGVATDFWTEASQRKAPLEKFLTPEHIAQAVVNVLEMEDYCVAREIVLRSLDDSDFSVQPPD